MDPATALGQLGGAARWPALAKAGVSRGGLLDAVRAGLVARPARGVFVAPTALDDPRVRALIARGQLSCAHAAAAHGLEVFDLPPAVHVRVPRRSARVGPPRRTTLHSWGRVGTSDLTPLAVTLLDCARCLDRPDAVAVLDSALRSGRLSMDELAHAAQGWSAAARANARMVDPQAQSVLESVGRVLLVQAGLGPVTSQVHLPRVGWVDLLVGGWLVVELDGYAVHRTSFHEDRRRDAELARLGYVVLRFTYADLRARRDWFVETVQETLDRGRPPFFWAGRDDFSTDNVDTPA